MIAERRLLLLRVVRGLPTILMALTTFGTVHPLLAIDSATPWIPASRWVRLHTAPTERFVPQMHIDCSPIRVLSNPVGRRASGAVYGNGQIFYFGGGGQSHPGNDVELYDIATNTWVQQYMPECLPPCCNEDDACDTACGIARGVGTTELTPMGRPYTEHSYRRIAYDPARGLFVAALTSGTWTWDPQSRDWTLLTPEIPFSAGIQTKTVAYDPDLETELFFATTKTHRVFRFDWASNSWVEHDVVPDALHWAEIYSAYDPRARRHLISYLRDGGTMWLYDAIGKTWDQLTEVPVQVLKASAMDYDPDQGMIVLVVRGGDGAFAVWTYDVAANEWSEQNLAGTAPESALRSFGTLASDPGSGRHFFVNVKSISSGFGTGGRVEGDVETWEFRLGTPADPPCIGDCSGDGEVTVDELIRGVQIALGQRPIDACLAFSRVNSDSVDVAALVAAVNRALTGCPGVEPETRSRARFDR